MRLIRDFSTLHGISKAQVVGIGNFDGVHLGHLAVLRDMTARARELDAESTVFTFHPHPMRVLAPDRAPLMIQIVDERIALLESAGVDNVILVEFTREFAGIGPNRFVEEFLVGGLSCAHLFVGADAKFGAGRAGNVDLLREYASAGAFGLTVMSDVTDGTVRVSSSRIRRLIMAGEVELAKSLLGRPFSLTGEVVHGVGRGRNLGFPTANIMPDQEIRPGDAVYAGRCWISDRAYASAIHVGPVPTFGQSRPVVEVHVIDFDGDLVGTRIRVEFLARLRGIVPFSSVETLVARIREDVGLARTFSR